VQLFADESTRARLEARVGELGLEKGSLVTYLAAHLSWLGPGDYLALMAYLPYADVMEQSLQAIRTGARDALHVATTLGYGPRFLHSTGQLHKGGPNKGLFVQVTADQVNDMPIPGDPYGFGVLITAQAIGDIISLQAKGLRVIRMHLAGDPAQGLQQLEAVFKEALALLKLPAPA
jgi:hypothetical protein